MKSIEVKLNEAAHEGHEWENDAEREGYALLDTVLREFMRYALENTEGATVPDDLDAREAVDSFEYTHFDSAVSAIHSAWKHLLAGAHDRVEGVDHTEGGGLDELIKLLGSPSPQSGLN